MPVASAVGYVRSKNGQASARVIARLTTLGVTVAIGMLVLGSVVLLDARKDAWRQAQRASTNLVVALERDIARNLATYDLSLQGTMEVLRLPGSENANSELRRMALFDRASNAEYLGSVTIFGADGAIIASSTSSRTPTMDLADRDYFRIHREKADAGLFVSTPYRSRMRGGEPTMAISRRMSNADGGFGGVVVGALRLAYFGDLFAKLDLGSGGAVSLIRTDGLLMARYPVREGDVGRSLAGAETFRRFTEAPSGQFSAKASLDGVERLYTFRHVTGMPLIINVAMSVDDIYAAWWRKAWVIGSVLSLLCLATIALCLMFRREIVRRLEAEVALTQAAEQLSAMASTDALTGLANRRKFDTDLSREWLRAIRNKSPISLLMLDADCFKAYNDAYGHQGGDDVLRSIGAAIRRTVRRPTDVGGRYGGEEFVVLLPETELEGALGVAELIRRSVEGLALPHAGGPAGWVTVSIGATTAYPRPGDEQSRLVEEADAALYVAKRSGRNQVSPVRMVYTPVVLKLTAA
jgi:diguanylate cyclase (GGDEF)-like protein